MELLDTFINHDVELRIYQVGDKKKYWIRAGAALLEFDEDRLVHLMELLWDFVEDYDG